MQVTKVNNKKFDRNMNFSLGRSRTIFMLWYPIKVLFFLSAWPWPSFFKSLILRCFGANIGKRVYWKPRINIHIPWKLSVGDDTWVGEEVCIYNFDKVSIGSNCCVSQRAFLCAASHDYKSSSMDYRHQPILIQDGAWIGAQCFVAPGVTVGIDAVTTAGSVITSNMPSCYICSGNPCTPVRPRWS